MYLQVNADIFTNVDTIDDMVESGFGLVADVIDGPLDNWILITNPGLDGDLYGASGCAQFAGERFINRHGNFNGLLELFRNHVGDDWFDEHDKIFDVLLNDADLCRQLGLEVIRH
jgi:hypothetical protein